MKSAKIFFIATIIFLSGCGQTAGPVATPPAPLATNHTYQDTAHHYAISYPDGFPLLDPATNDADLALQIPATFAKGTNLNGGAILVRALTDTSSQEYKICAAHKNPFTGVPLTEMVTQSGQTFYHYAIADAGAGHQYHYDGYYGFDAATQTCFHISLQLDLSNPDMYDPAQRPTVFDTAGITKIFEEIFQTFARNAS